MSASHSLRHGIQQAIDEVYKTLFEAAILVLIVILVFLQSWRALLVPGSGCESLAASADRLATGLRQAQVVLANNLLVGGPQLAAEGHWTRRANFSADWDEFVQAAREAVWEKLRQHHPGIEVHTRQLTDILAASIAARCEIPVHRVQDAFHMPAPHQAHNFIPLMRDLQTMRMKL